MSSSQPVSLIFSDLQQIKCRKDDEGSKEKSTSCR